MTEEQLQRIYRIPRRHARQGQPFYYGGLTREYAAAAPGEERVDPHAGWVWPLDTINKRLKSHDLPPISAIVVSQTTAMPGVGFWDACERTRAVPVADRDRIYAEILNDVRQETWPIHLPD